MKKKLTAIVAILLVLTFVGCGDGVKVATTRKLETTLPATISVTGTEITEENNLILTGTKNDDSFFFTLTPETDVFFDGESLVLASLQKGQTVYLDGSSQDNIKTAIIKNWPGMRKKDDVMVYTASDVVPLMISKYLEKNHPEMGVDVETTWEEQDPISKLPPRRYATMYRFKQHLMMVRWSENEYPIYNILIMPNLDAEAIWSGKVNEYGEIEEIRYEKN